VKTMGIDPGEVQTMRSCEEEEILKRGESTTRVRRIDSRNPTDRLIWENLCGSYPLGARREHAIGFCRIGVHRGEIFILAEIVISDFPN